MLPLARPVAVVHGYSRLPHFLPLPFDNCGADQTGTTHRGDISREGGLVVGPSDRPCHSRDRFDAHRLRRAISDFHPPAHWPPNEPTLRIGPAIAVVSPVAIAAPAPANFLPLQYVLSL